MASPIRRAQLSNDIPLGATKDPCRLSTTVNDTLSGLAARDGVTPVADDRVLVRAQSTPSQNGIYVAAAGAWSRADDFATDDDVDSGALFPVSEGTANSDSVWQLTTNAPITLGATVLAFGIVSKAGVDPAAHGTRHDPGGADAITTAAASGLTANSANSEGTNTSLARSDHGHDIDTAGGTIATVNAGDAAAEGSGTGLARRDHQHPVATAAPSTGIGGANAEGASASLARADHNHTLRTTTGPTDLDIGAVADGDFIKRVGTQLVGSMAGIGDVVGPGSSTDDGIARFDGVTGLLLQDTSGPTIPDDGSISMASKKITSLLAGTAGTDAVNKAQLDASAAGVDWKESARLATDAALPANTAAGSKVGKTLTADANGALTVDGVAVANGDRVLVKDEATGSDNGIYDVTDLGSAGTPYILTRSTDSDEDAEVTASMAAFAEEGTNNADTGWTLTTDDPITVDTTALVFTQFTGLGQVVAGTGLTKSGSTLNAVANADGSIAVNADDIQVGVLATDAQHGVRGGGTQHADAIAAGASGFMTGADKTKLDGVTAGANPNLTWQQETLTTETITNSDTAMTDNLNATPADNASLVLSLNGIVQIQGAGNDYSVSGTAITWLASSGTAVNQKTTDTLMATYQS